ncbi:MAG: glycosyltransferase family 39 protein [Spirochaetales bacterium]|nr:glycosyltransferase family 39 protein [Spirochaetales bacterium]
MIAIFFRALLILLGGVFLLRNLHFALTTLRWPVSISPDAVILRFEAAQMLKGRFPGVDFVSINLPFTHYVHALGLCLFGFDDTGFRILDLLWLSGTAGLLFFVLRAGAGRYAAVSSVVLFSLFPVEATPYGSFQREVILFPLLLGVIYLLQHLEKSPASGWELFLYAGTGALQICSFLIKPPVVLFFLFMNLYHLFIVSRKTSSGFLWQRVAAFMAGGIIALLAIGLPLLWHGALVEYFAGWQTQTSVYLELVETRDPVLLAFHLFTLWPPRFLLSLNEGYLNAIDTGHFGLFHLLLICVWCVLAFRYRFHPAPLFLFIAGVLMYLVQLRGFQYHLYISWLACIIMLAELMGVWLTRSSMRSLAVAGLLAILTLLWQERSLRIYRGTGLLTRERPVGFLLPETLKDMSASANYRSMVSLEHASIALSAARPGVLEFLSPYPVDYVLRKPSPHQAGARTRFMQAVQKRPDLIVISHEVAHSPPREIQTTEWGLVLGDDPLPADYRDFAALRNFLGEHYRLSRVIAERNADLYTVYEIRAGSRQ